MSSSVLCEKTCRVFVDTVNCVICLLCIQMKGTEGIDKPQPANVGKGIGGI